MSVWSFWSFSSGDGSAHKQTKRVNILKSFTALHLTETIIASCGTAVVISDTDPFSFLLSSPAASLVYVWVFQA